MMLTVLFLRSPTNLRAYGADDDKAHPISVLHSVRVTLTNHYWVTSPERRRRNGKGQTPTSRMAEGHGPDQLAAKLEQPMYVTCSCCGEMIEDSTDQNASFGLEPYPHDQGF